MAPWTYSGDQWIAYDNVDSITFKVYFTVQDAINLCDFNVILDANYSMARWRGGGQKSSFS